jgi:hypothetical protein
MLSTMKSKWKKEDGRKNQIETVLKSVSEGIKTILLAVWFKARSTFHSKFLLHF